MPGPSFVIDPHQSAATLTLAMGAARNFGRAIGAGWTLQAPARNAPKRLEIGVADLAARILATSTADNVVVDIDDIERFNRRKAIQAKAPGRAKLSAIIAKAKPPHRDPWLDDEEDWDL